MASALVSALLKKKGLRILHGKSLFIFRPSNKIRQFLDRIVDSTIFSYIINLFIFVSTITLALQHPLNDPKGSVEVTCYWIDVSTTSIFMLEMVMKITAKGFALCGEKSYIRQPWNILDCMTVIVSILSLTPLPNQLSVVKVFRILRPLRVIGRNEGLKLAVKSLVYSIPSLAHLIMITFMFFAILSIINVSFLKGKLYYCSNSFISDFPLD